ncbi:Peptidoglycan/LPS O-acetylase OafA/YrhL, contains acyltransferase and SGNH-hydrolase domains [Verrucomicrobium sp. GAS474]|uniref:acyltransferase family protein n=1 Tax=Verrucomicrobium sp. GAS474 TaxID=1882831 RepID=UPI00087B89C4|nr:acyltransferase [Verrucomicrobium sp. GAS474]SDU14231.1 Peptidoglycan/LPS O-acetylase OafA/YrhL, contains acyltransferase and SGNH-hydrolase domains [Verrucomicrobium sp. GAS474]
MSQPPSSSGERPQGSPSGNKLLGLELIRFLSAMAVVVFHYRHFAYIGNDPIGWVRENQPFYPLLKSLYDFGNYGVPIFWCISGYIFFWKYGHAIREKNISAGRFFILRFSRLYPLHLATLLLVCLLQWCYLTRHHLFFVYRDTDTLHFLLQLFMASDWINQSHLSFNGPVWSISLEVLIYMVFFCVTFRFGASFRVSLIVLGIFGVLTAMHGRTPLFDCVLYFYLGGTMTLLGRLASPDSKSKDLLLKVLLAGFLIATPIMEKLLHWNPHPGTPIEPLLSYLYIPALVLFFARDISIPDSLRKYVESAGNMTYSSYLLHFPIQLGLVLIFTRSGQGVPLYHNAFFLLYMGITCVAAFLAYRYFEAPAQASIRKNGLRKRA